MKNLKILVLLLLLVALGVFIVVPFAAPTVIVAATIQEDAKDFQPMPEPPSAQPVPAPRRPGSRALLAKRIVFPVASKGHGSGFVHAQPGIYVEVLREDSDSATVRLVNSIVRVPRHALEPPATGVEGPPPLAERLLELRRRVLGYWFPDRG